MIAAEVMTPKPRTVRSNTSVDAALDLLWSLDVRHLPVLDEEGELVGMLSDRDLGSYVKSFTDGEGDASGRVGDLMSTDVVTVETDAELSDVIDTLIEQKIGAVPVVDGEGRLAGIISYVDVLRTYAGELSGNGGPAPKRAAPKKAAPKKAVPTKKKAAPAPKKAAPAKASPAKKKAAPAKKKRR